MKVRIFLILWREVRGTTPINHRTTHSSWRKYLCIFGNGCWCPKVAKLIVSALRIDSSVIIDSSILEAGGKGWY
jgi:hypothetical protein